MTTPATLNSGKANRRYVILAVVLGLLGAILVYAAFSRDSGSSNNNASSSASNVPVVVAKVDIPARTKVTATMLGVVLVPPDARGAEAFSDVSQVVGQVTRFPIQANEQLLQTKVIPLNGTLGVGRALSYTIPQGERAIAISASQIMDAGGLVLPGDYVDILVVYDMQFPENGQLQSVSNYLVQTLMQNVEVLAVSQTVVDTVPEAEPSPDNNQIARNSDAAPVPDASTITLAVSPEDAQKLYLAESNGHLRLSVRAYGDGEEQPIDFLVQPDIFPDNIPNPFQQ